MISGMARQVWLMMSGGVKPGATAIMPTIAERRFEASPADVTSPTRAMARVGLVTSAGLASNRRSAIVGMIAVAPGLTPPDIISQTCLAIPLIILYEVSIYSCRMVEKARAKREAEEEAELGGGDTPAAGA